ncbi:hypothetical protein [Agriterribacter humi]|uniref:hypothetical protein n=1 Tax=Agriterribacter humi TaxID=1104781 RepID=UPI0012652848|nr:hypothetical protein [Agriterribacter humi]
MTKAEIEDFINENSEERVFDFYSRMYTKLTTTNKRLNTLTLYMLIVGLTYFISSSDGLLSISMGPFGLKDFSLIAKLMPLAFAYLLMEYALLSKNQSELLQITKTLAFEVYNQQPEEKYYNLNHINSFLSAILPFSIITQFSRLVTMKGSILTTIFLFILWLPLLGSIILPISYGGWMLYNIKGQYPSDLLVNVVLAISIWLLLLTLFFYIRPVENQIKNNKQLNQ